VTSAAPPDASFDLTAIVSTHARPVEVRHAIDAVRNQDFAGRIETIVVYDKAEPDLSLEVEDDRRPVRVVKNHRNPGLPGSRNTGADLATAPFIAFCDDDDVWHHDKVAKQLAELERTGLDTCITGIDVVIDGERIPRVGDEPDLQLEHFLRNRRLEAHMSGTVVRRDAFFGPIGVVDEHIPGGCAEDYDWILRAARHGSVAVVREPLVDIRWAGSHFRDKWADWEGAHRQMLETFPEFETVPTGKARIEGQLAFAIAAQGRRKESLAHVRRTLRWNWKEPRAYLTLVVASGLVSADRIVAFVNKRGRGI
jgi:glycosyltransferase involved in cell wall biosynthesis